MEYEEIAPETKPTHKTPSGMGGVFNIILKEKKGEKQRVIVINKQSSFNGYTFFTNIKNIKELKG